MKKFLICNKSSVEKKYANMASVFWLQIDRMIAVYESKGHTVALICVDDSATMAKYRLNPVTEALDDRQNKEAIDGIFTSAAPDCIVIIGAHDIFPFQNLKDQTVSREHFIPSDLPYACTAVYSQDIKDFLVPTRMVTRLPDLYGANASFGLDIFIKTIDNAISVYPRKIDEYDDVFCLYAKVWSIVTDYTLNAFNPPTTNHKYSSPDYESPWGQEVFEPYIHLINCHGAKLDNKFYGQSGRNLPVAIIANDLGSGIRNGTIALVLCCFGAQLFYVAGKIPFSNEYLRKGAVMFASTVKAYTGAAENFSAIFLNYIRHRRQSVQYALLHARLDYISKQTGPLNAIQQKTVAEFVLYGDCGEPYVITKSQEESEDLKKKIGHIQSTAGFAKFNPQLSAPPEIIGRIEQDRIKGNLKNQSEIMAFDVEGVNQSNKASEFAQTKQYLVAMTDEDECRHQFVYTVKNGVVTDVKDYVEKL